MTKRELYSGKAKTIYATSQPDQYIMHFRDDASAFDGVKKAQLANKGVINNYTNSYIMHYLSQRGIGTHLIELINSRESLVKQLDMIPVECVVRNYAAGSLCRRLDITEGQALTPAIFEFFYKNDALHDPLINASHIQTFGWASDAEINQMRHISFQVNELLTPLFAQAGLLLVDYKLEFGRCGNELLLGDEFTLDGCRVWEQATGKKLDKDRFRQDLGNVIESYTYAAQQLGIPIPE